MAHRVDGKKFNPYTARLLDANLNRAREGLRVLEDTARFIWNDNKLFQALRGHRHKLHSLTTKHYKDLVKARKSETDFGRLMKEGSSHANLTDVVGANIHRAQEALRVLEEYSRVFSAKAGPGFKKIRYALYSEEKNLLAKSKE
jgi:thiamine-phosphate pyrophosphorylase